jgi:predicted aldo/keto reductase-like oxidoreductase
LHLGKESIRGIQPERGEIMARYTTTRRDFMKTTALGLAASAAMPAMAASKDIPTRAFGKTGEQVSILAVGGHHIGRIRDEQESIRLIRTAIDEGVTFMDNAYEYHNGRSEELMGKALQDGYREKAFLMTKHHGRKDKKVAMAHLEASLRRLKTDVIDLWQFHEVVYYNDPDMIFSEGGAIEAADEARKQGKVRYIGFTGHKDPKIHLDMLSRDYEWDAVQMPINPLDAHFRSFEKEVLPVLLERNIAPIAMKTVAGGHLKRANVDPAAAIRYAWCQPVATVVSGMENMELLRANIELARSFTPMSDEEMQNLLASTKEAAMTGEYELFKTTRNYDGRLGREIHGITG